MAGPSLAGFTPSRKVYDSYTQEAGIFNNTLGNANLSPLKDITQGIDAGLNTANNMLNFIATHGPEGMERRRIDMEAAKINLEVNKKRLELDSIKARHAAALDNSQLAHDEAKLSMDTLKYKTTAQNYGLLKDLSEGLGQINDAQSLADYISNPRWAPLRSTEEYGNIIRHQAAQLLSTARSAQEQVNLVRAAETASPGSSSQLRPLMSSQAQQLIAAPSKSGGSAEPKKSAAQLAREENINITSQGAYRQLMAKIPQGYNYSWDEANDQLKVWSDDPSKGSPREISIKDVVDISGMDGNLVKLKLREMIRSSNPPTESDYIDKASDVPKTISGQNMPSGSITGGVKTQRPLTPTEKSMKSRFGLTMENSAFDPVIEGINVLANRSESIGDREVNALKKKVESIAVLNGIEKGSDTLKYLQDTAVQELHEAHNKAKIRRQQTGKAAKEIRPGSIGSFTPPTSGPPSSYGNRSDGSPKGSGFLGEVNNADGSVSTELSFEFEADGRTISAPLLVPTLSKEEITHLQSGKKPTDAIYKKAEDHAMKRISQGQSPFKD